MTEKKPDTVGSFLGLITKDGKLRLQMRTEKGSSITGISYKGDFELTGGGVKELDLRKVLTPQCLLDEAIREAREELGIVVATPTYFCLYRTVFENPKTGKVDWAFMIPIYPILWNDTSEMKRKTVDVDPDQLNVLGELNLIVSGKKRMWRMGEAAIFMMNTLGFSREDWLVRADELLTEAKPDWKQTELFWDADEALSKFRREIGIE